MANSVNPDQTAPIGAVCSGSTLLACILKFASYVWQLFPADDIFRCIFSWRFKGYQSESYFHSQVQSGSILQQTDMTQRK